MYSHDNSMDIVFILRDKSGCVDESRSSGVITIWQLMNELIGGKTFHIKGVNTASLLKHNCQKNFESPGRFTL
jgi:hypothetical protein